MNDIIELNKNEPSYIDALTESITKIQTNDYNKKECILNQINNFFQAVEQNQPKTHLFVDEDEYEGKKIPYIHLAGKKQGQFKSRKHRELFETKWNWSVKDTLANWWTAVLSEIDLKLEDLKNKIKNYSSLGDTPIQQQIISPFAGEIRDVHPDEFRKFDKTMYEYLEWELIKTKETIIEFINGTFILNEDEIIKENIKTEIGKMVLESGSKIDKLKVEARKLVNNKKIKK